MLNDLPSIAPTSANGQLVVTSGFKDPTSRRSESLYPAGIPIGTVSSTNPQNSVQTNQQVQVTPLVDLQHLSLVQILTRPARRMTHWNAAVDEQGLAPPPAAADRARRASSRCVIQEAVISQISLFGVHRRRHAAGGDVDRAAVPDRCRARSPASRSACSSTSCMFQTVGVTSLLFITVGYWSGRLRELRDPVARADPACPGRDRHRGSPASAWP